MIDQFVRGVDETDHLKRSDPIAQTMILLNAKNDPKMLDTLGCQPEEINIGRHQHALHFDGAFQMVRVSVP